MAVLLVDGGSDAEESDALSATQSIVVSQRPVSRKTSLEKKRSLAATLADGGSESDEQSDEPVVPDLKKRKSATAISEPDNK